MPKGTFGGGTAEFAVGSLTTNGSGGVSISGSRGVSGTVNIVGDIIEVFYEDAQPDTSYQIILTQLTGQPLLPVVNIKTTIGFRIEQFLTSTASAIDPAAFATAVDFICRRG